MAVGDRHDAAPGTLRLKTVVQRVARAAVRVDGTVVGEIDRGLLLLVGVERDDTDADADTTARKTAALRLFGGRTPLDRTVAEWGGASRARRSA